MLNSITSINNLIKSLIRLQLVKSEIKSNYYNNKKNYSVFLQQNSKNNINNNNCINNKVTINRYNHDNQQESIKNKVRNYVPIRRRGNILKLNSKEVKKSSRNVDESPPVIFESIHPSVIIKKPMINSVVNDEDIEIDDENEYLTDETAMKYKIPGALDICTEDLSHITPFVAPSFTFAAYANKSETIQQLVKLGVELYKLEKSSRCMLSILRRNFDDIKPYIQFLYDCKVSADEIGRVFTKFPLIIEEDLDDLHTRIRYLRAHKFTILDVERIVTSAPRWLGFTTKQIDSKLGYIQVELKLSGSQLRHVMSRQPKLILAKKSQLRESFFSVKEEMCFDEEQIKKIIMNKPGLFMIDRRFVATTFDYVNNDMLIPHEYMANMPVILMTPLTRIKDRHEFLKLLKRNQYDPTKPLYVSLDDIACPTDYEFCSRVARTSIGLFDMFLKTR